MILINRTTERTAADHTLRNLSYVRSGLSPLEKIYLSQASFYWGVSCCGPTETEVGAKKEALDDVISSTKAAVAERIMPDGRFALLR